MDKVNEFRRYIKETEDRYEKKKNKTNLYTFIGLSIAFYVIGIWLGWIQDATEYLYGLAVAPICAGIYMYVSLLIFLPIINCRTNEIQTMTRLRSELSYLEKEQFKKYEGE
jgi:hypothetical protein